MELIRSTYQNRLIQLAFDGVLVAALMLAISRM